MILLPRKRSKLCRCWWRVPSRRKSNEGENQETKLSTCCANWLRSFLKSAQERQINFNRVCYTLRGWLKRDAMFLCSRKYQSRNCRFFFFFGIVFEDLIADFSIVSIIFNERFLSGSIEKWKNLEKNYCSQVFIRFLDHCPMCIIGKTIEKCQK